MGKIKIIMFDLAGVFLLGNIHDFFRDVEKILSLENGCIDLNINPCCLDSRMDVGDISIIDLIEETTKKKINNEKKELILNKWNNAFNKNEELEKYLYSIKDEYKLGVISNTDRDNARNHRDTGKISVFNNELVFLSAEHKMKKPDKAFFVYILNKINTRYLHRLEVSEILFIDDCQENLDVAKSLGMKTYLYKNSETAVNDLKEVLENPMLLNKKQDEQE